MNERYRSYTLIEEFRIVGLWGGRHEEEFKYPELRNFRFHDLPDEEEIDYSVILEKL